MPPKGGSSDKLGGRFEDLVAVWRLLELLNERYSAARMRIEQPGEDGFEWWVEHVEAARTYRTYAQVKRQQSPDDQWKIGMLASRGVLGDFVTKLRSDSSAVCEFVSTLSATHLQDLIESAGRTETVAEFENYFIEGTKKTSWDKVCEAWSAEPTEAWQLLQRIKVTTISEPTLEEAVRDRIAALITGDPNDIIGALLGFIDQQLSRTIDAAAVRAFLRERGLQLTDWQQDASIHTQIAATTERYRRRLDDDRGRLDPISRSLAADVADALIAPDGPSVITVVAEAGMGKSDVLGQDLLNLETRQDNDGHSIVLALRLDQLPDFGDAHGLGQVLGLPASPVLVLSRIAAGTRAVLVLDQLDAFSAASGRKSAAVDALAELLHQARNLGVRVVMACRAFDVENDPRLSSLTGKLSGDGVREGYRVETLERLSNDEVDHALTAAGTDPAALMPQLRSLLSTPLYLQMLVTLQIRGRVDPTSINTRFELFEKFFEDVRIEVESREPNAEVEAATSHLAGALSDRQALSAPVAVLHQYRATVRQLKSAGWLREESGRVQFSHEAYFDYAYALLHISSGRSLLDLLRSGEQRLFRRSQVRQILTLEQDQDRAQYLRDVGELLGAEDVRPHIKEIVIALATRVPNPTIEEWQALQRLGDPTQDRLAERAYALACQAPAFARLLLDTGTIQALMEDDATRQLGTWMCRLAARACPDQVASALSPHTDEPAWASSILNVLNIAPLGHSDALVEVFVALIGSGLIDEQVRDTSEKGDFFSLVIGMNGAQAVRGLRLVAAWVRRRLTLRLNEVTDTSPAIDDDNRNGAAAGCPTDDDGGSDEDELAASLLWLGDGGRLLAHSLSATQALATLAHDDPRAYVEHLMPVIRHAAQYTRTNVFDPEHGGSSDVFRTPPSLNADLDPTDALLTRLAQALHTSVNDDDQQAHDAVRDIARSTLQVEQFLAAVGFATGHPDLLNDAMAWLESGPYALGQGWHERPVGLSGAALAAVCATFAPEVTAAIQARAANHITEYEDQNPESSGWTAHTLLQCVSDSTLTEPALARKRELASRFPTAPAKVPAASETATTTPDITFAMPSRPSITSLSDSELLDWLAASVDDGSGTPPAGYSFAFADKFDTQAGLRQAAQQQPERFIALLSQLPAGLPSSYIGGILNGLTQADITAARRLEAVLAARDYAVSAHAALAELVRQAGRQLPGADGDLSPIMTSVADMLVQLLGTRDPNTTPSANGTEDATGKSTDGAGIGAAAVGGTTAGTGAGEQSDRPWGSALSQLVWQQPEFSLLSCVSVLANELPSAHGALMAHVGRLARSPNLVLRATAIMLAADVGDRHPDDMVEIITNVVGHGGHSGTPPSEPALTESARWEAMPELCNALIRVSWSHYHDIEPVLDQMLAVANGTYDPDFVALIDQIRENVATIYATASCQDNTALQHTRQLLAGPIRFRVGVATGLALAVPASQLGSDQLDILETLFDDSDDQVVRRAITVLQHLPADQPALACRLIASANASRAFTVIPGVIILAAKRHQKEMPSTILDMAERFIGLNVDTINDPTSGNSHNAATLGRLVVGVYTHANDDQTSARALDLIDRFIVERTFGIDEHLSQLNR